VTLAPWEQAERGREALEAIPEGDRTRGDYTRAMDGYRAIYHADPADLHAPAAVNAVAELLAEQGRRFHDAKSLMAAVGQYEFLRAQYPASSLDVQALLAEGQIEENDLGDRAAAREKYKLLLKDHPKSEQAEEARAGLESVGQVAGVGSPLPGKTAAGRNRSAGSANELDAIQKPAVSDQPSAVSRGTSLPAMAQTSGGRANSAATQSIATTQPTLHDEAVKDGPPSSVSDLTHRDKAVKDGPPSVVTDPTHRDTTAMNGAPVAAPVAVAVRSGKRALVTGIRHWSTATYTRVAIDLGDSVTYEAARVPNPDRIYFDLHGSRLAQELVGKSFAVTDDGFLKKVRAAQYSDDVTRVVLDVNDVTEYSAFLLPNPYRLIIDIHGGKASGRKEQATASAEAPAAMGPAVAVEAPAPRAAVVAKATPARPVPNSMATRSANAASEVADLSDMPGRVDATSKPTSKPISAVVDEQGSRPEVRSSSRDSRGSVSGVPDASGATEPTLHDEAVKDGPPAVVAAAPSTAASSRKTRRNGAKSGTTASAVADATPARAAAPMADGETSLVRALGLKIGRIVIDAGHGGHDSGTLGVDGIQEKDVVLDVAQRLGKLLHDRLGAEIIYTRSDDTFIPLETRTAIANKAQADLFLSIHANSSPDASARGVETYYLNFTSDPTALDVAARENAVSDQSIHQLSDLVKKIALKDKIAESREFAADVEGSLYSGLEKGNAGLKDRGVKKAPFVVLIGANMPSILAEISFVTNPKDASQLAEPEYRERVAESIYKGVARYEGGLSGTRVTTERAAVGQ
jgi:N-acetylmuramoyl-L-alanine amidase